MGKTWVLDSETKGTGARVVPLEQVKKERGATKQSPPRPARERPARAEASRPRPQREPEVQSETLTELPPGHVRKKATGEIGRVRAIDPKAGTASVYWLKRGATSTVPLATVTRR